MKDEDMIVITVEGLAKRFGEVQAVADVSFQIQNGELFGFLGPNGAGKTTTIHHDGNLTSEDGHGIHGWYLPGRTQARSVSQALSAPAIPRPPSTCSA